jgi:hypothetical protein
MSIHESPRATVDLDVLVLSGDLDKVRLTAESQGYDNERIPLHFSDGAIEIRRISKIDRDTKR